MSNEFIVKNGLIVGGTVVTSGTITINGALAATQSWVTSQAYLTSASLSGYATQSYVTSAISALIDAAPAALDTLNELAAALGDDASFSTTITNSIASKQAQLNGTGLVRMSGTTVSYDNTTYLISNFGNIEGEHSFGYPSSDGWYKIAEVVLNGTCQSYNLWGEYRDTGYFDNSHYRIHITARAECDFLSNNESHAINVNIYGSSTNETYFTNNVRVILTSSSSNYRKYELQYYRATWDTGSWRLQTLGWTTYATSQTAGTSTGTPRVYYISKFVADNIYAANKISIGTSYSGFAANIAGTTYIIGASAWVNDAYGYVNASSPGTGFFPYSDGNSVIASSNTTRLFVNGSTGNIGIGTSSPSTKLEVNGGTGSASGNIARFTLGGAGGGTRGLTMYSDGSQFKLQVSDNVGGIGSWAFLNLNPDGGNVGIGTTAPDEKLQVAGNIKIQNETGLITDYGPLVGRYNTSQVYVGTGGNYSIVKIGRADGGALNVLSGGDVGIGSTTTSGYKLYVNGSTWINGGTNFTDGVSIFRTQSGGAEVMRVASNSNVGIGTTSPNYKLDVNGSINIYTGNSLRWGSGDAEIINSGYNLLFKTYNGSALAEAMRINSAGKVSIGTTSTNSDQSDFTVYTGGTTTLALSGGEFRVGDTDVNWSIALRQNGVLETYGQNLNLRSVAGNYPVIMQPNGTSSVEFYQDYTLFNGLNLSISRVNSAHASNYFRGDSSHLVIGTGGTLYLNYGGSTTNITGNTTVSGLLGVTGIVSANARKLSLGILDLNTSGVPGQFKIKTSIPWNYGGSDFTVNIKGFRYGSSQMVSLSIGWHFYNNEFYSRNAICNGAWAPTITLAKSPDGYVIIHLPSPDYWAKLYVESVYSSNSADSYTSGWSWSDADLSDCTLIQTVPYRDLATNISGNAATATFATTAGALSSMNISQFTNNSGYITSYTETDTLQSVTSRGNSTTNRINVRGIGNQSGGNIMMGDVGQGTNKWSYLTGTHYNASSQPQGFALIGGLSTDSYNAVVIGGNIYETNPATEIQFWTHSATTHNLGGTQRGVITSAGNWGIGTTSPQSRLHVETSSSNVFRMVRGSTSFGFEIGGGTIGLYDYDDSVYRWYVDSIGNLGIGTTGPEAKLHVVSGSGQAGFLSRGSNGDTWFPYSNGQNYVRGVTNFDLGSVYFTGGNIGIGTTSPSYKLDINGNSRTTGIHYVDTYLVTPLIYGGGPITMGNNVFINSTEDGKLTLRVPSGDSSEWNYINFTGSNGVRDAYLGTDGGGAPIWYRDDNGVNITLGSSVLINGNTAWHAGNDGSGSGLDADTVDGVQASSLLRSDIYNSNYGGLQVFRNIGTIDGSWPDSDHTFGLENSDAGNIVINFHRAGYTSNNLWYNGSKFRFDAALESTGIITATGGNSTNWNTAYGWGNHASAGYAAASSLANYLPLAGGTLSGSITATRFQGVNSLVLNNYTIVNPSSNVFLYSQPNDRDAWIFLDSADTGSNWGIYHRQIDTTVGDIPANSIGFVGGGASILQAYISLANGNAYFRGNLVVGGVITESSSIKLKENIETSEGNLEKVVNLRPVTYNKIGSQTTELGLIAEEVAEVYPEFVQYDENGEPVGVHYSRLTAALIGAVKELNEQLQELKRNK